MKKTLFLALATSLLFAAPVSVEADIQDPPAGSYTMTRKLGRAVGNIIYGALELPATVFNTHNMKGRTAAGGYGILDGTGRSAMRVGYGLFELVTFPFPSYKGGYAPPMKDGRIYPYRGYSEFPPQLGIAGEAQTYNRIGG